jgi:hypothetical protein
VLVRPHNGAVDKVQAPVQPTLAVRRPLQFGQGAVPDTGIAIVGGAYYDPDLYAAWEAVFPQPLGSADFAAVLEAAEEYTEDNEFVSDLEGFLDARPWELARTGATT